MIEQDKFFPLKTKCSWFDEQSKKELTGWVVIVPGSHNGYYTMSTKFKSPTWDKDDKSYFIKCCVVVILKHENDQFKI